MIPNTTMIEVTMSMTEDLIPEPIVKTEKVMKEEKINMMSLNTTDLITRDEDFRPSYDKN